jgi:REP element-mobilizing transposase RayT
MGKTALETQTKIYAWALMPNHVHILLRSGLPGLSKFMRRLLTGYAVTYNLRHGRHGHLFQNRFKSIVCDEDGYFRELVRYIHLNPLRAKLIKSMTQLDRYPWCGHSVLMGKRTYEWQDGDYVLSWFGKKAGEAKKAYRQFVARGIHVGKRPDLVGGGLVRSLGGWSEVLSLRRSEQELIGDQRVLGTGDFVERILGEANERVKYQLSGSAARERAHRLINEKCAREGVNINELRTGSRRGSISQLRSELAFQLVNEFGIPLAETGRQLGVSTSAISKMLMRRKGNKST